MVENGNVKHIADDDLENFNVRRFTELSRKCAENPNSIDVSNFADLLLEICLLLGSFGKAMGMAFSGKSTLPQATYLIS